MSMFTRKKFIITTITGAAGITLIPQVITGQQVPQTVKPPTAPPLSIELVKEFVIAGHGNMDKTKSMLQETPDLLNASYNWKEWDWEDAVGGAGHVGSRELAIYLLEQGARPTVCIAAMLGKIEVVKAFITTFPQMKDAVGPHRISLMRHAKAGGENAKEVYEYLQSVGAKE